MSTIASRTVRSSPYRDTTETWAFIVEMLTKGKDSDARKELLSVTGIASSVIGDQAPKDAAITVTCDGPRTRVYCAYDEAALDDSSAKEDALGFDALKGDWALSLPCQAEDLGWVQGALKAKSSRITARDRSTKMDEEEKGADKSAGTQSFTVDLNAFLKS